MPITLLLATLETFQVQTQSNIEQWPQQFQDAPDYPADVEQQIDEHYRRGGGPLIAASLARGTQDPQMEKRIVQTRHSAAIPLRGSRP